MFITTTHADVSVVLYVDVCVAKEQSLVPNKSSMSVFNSYLIGPSQFYEMGVTAGQRKVSDEERLPLRKTMKGFRNNYI